MCASLFLQELLPLQTQEVQKKLQINPISSLNERMSCQDKSNYGLPQTPTLQYFPQPVLKSEADPYPTTFVQANKAAFKQVVQLLTGSSETVKQASDAIQASLQVPPSRNVIPPRKQGPKLYERRNNNINYCPLLNTAAHRTVNSNNNSAGFSPVKPEVLSPSTLDFPRLALSPVTPLSMDLFNKSSPGLEEKAIAQKKFYMHPSPRTARNVEPTLLPLFPSPRD